ncbi:MAG: hypothetical protein GY765_20650 [bacterium]|nr:hypothetical protein [bacterium]
MVGNSNPFFVTAMMTGIVVVVLSAIIYLLTFKANYRRYLDPVTKAGILRTSLPRKLLNKFLHRFIVRDPLERAIFHFTYKTILRNRNAKLKLVLFIALPLSIAATEFIYIALEKGINYFAAIDTYWITIPFVFLSSLVVGTKYVLMQPVQIDANWIFKITGSKIGRCYKKGVSKAILVYGMLPLNLVVLAVSFLFWGPVPALLFTYYCALLSIISVEASFVGCNKIPFACEYSPTKLKLKTRWPIYLLSYFICLALFEVLAVFLLKNNVFFTLYTLLIAVAYAILRKVRKRNEVAEIVYEEDEEQDMITLGFD